ncbi:MAG: YhgE/Pip domain-containing protein [Lachnospiraceae bacterium]|nr:YhgE/Pip domain-containing protein [Lachnospiraceae bacterium]
MTNIFRIASADIKRLVTNVVAIVIIMGLSVMPCLYAWFNILSNWDPYGEDATKNLQVVVVSADKGVEIGGIELNVGDMIVSNLKENKTIGWKFVDTKEEAESGVYSGKYYAALVVDENFSSDIISFLGGELENPKITYYENEKKNAIAPKITGKVKTTLEEEIDKAFVSTMAKTMLEVSDYIATSDETDSTGLTNKISDKLQRLDGDMTTYITILESYISIIDAAENLTETTGKMSNQLDSMMATGRSIINSADSAINSGQNAIDTTGDTISVNILNIKNTIYNISDMTDDFVGDVELLGTVSSSQVDSLIAAIDSLRDTYNINVRDTVSQNSAIEENKATVDSDLEKVQNDLVAIKSAGDATSEDAKSLALTLKQDMDKCKNDIDNLYNTYNNTINPQLKNTMNDMQGSIDEVQQILNYSSENISDVSKALNSYPDMVGFGKEKLTKTLESAKDMQSKLRELMADINDLESDTQYATLMKLIESDPELIADFISSPVNLDEQPIYVMENNGSATAPFYVILSIWFGALILIAIIHTSVKTIPSGCVDVKNYQLFFGRYIVFFLVGQVQTLITVLGSLLFVGIQCEHPFMYWMAAAISSFTFTLFMYSLSYALGNVGEAAAVILLVIQVAGSGGTFPVEVLPTVFQYLYKYMPFAYGMNAIRESIAGMHGHDYWGYLAGMGIYILAALVLGLVISIPCKKLNAMIEESKENTDLLV